jgi:pimeloyl-ACP methyl ester carboxylesterase/class 3 adenylate cyclase
VRYCFGDRVIDTDTRELRHNDTLVEIEPQVFDVLAYLAANFTRVVPKTELLDEVWGDRFVSESALTTRIKQARQAVGDTGREQSVIKTAHGRGYRFVAPVLVDHAPEPDLEPPTTRSAITRVPRTHYAESNGATIAYQTFGNGPDIVFIAGFTTNLEVQWEHPAIASALRRLGSFARVTMLDKRGVGLSERMPRDNPPALETRADDLVAVMDAARIPRATILGSSEGGSLAALFAASHPERVERLILHDTWMKGGDLAAANPASLDLVADHWGSGGILSALGPSLGADTNGRAVLARLERQAATPRAARLLLELSRQIDITPALPAISAPTLVIHREDDEIVPLSQGQSLAESIPGARLVVLPDADHWIFSGDLDSLLDHIKEFVVGSPAAPLATDRVLATVLFVDIKDSTVQAQQLGDGRWTELLDGFENAGARVVDEFRGELVNTTGDGLVATFDGPGRAVQAASALRTAVAPLGIALRSGLHTAEIERRGTDIAGIGVHIAARVAAAASPGEIWVSRTVTDLVAGTGLEFDDRGTHTLKGLDQPWALYAARL